MLVTFCLIGLTATLAQALNEATTPKQTPNSLAATSFPTDAAETFKIELDTDGIYQITQQDLANAGMNVATVNPHTIEMMYRGQAVAYQFVGDEDTNFEDGEYILFYGWAFAGPRTEKQFINNNVFWLWAGGTPKLMGHAANLTEGSVVDSLVTAVTKEPENIFTTTYTDQWDTFPNQPDSWYWDHTLQGNADLPPAPLTKTYQIDLPHLDAAATIVPTYTIELLSRESATSATGIVYTVTSSINNDPGLGLVSWTEAKSVNINNTVPLSALNEGTNEVDLVYNSSSNAAQVFLNRITVAYPRQLQADNNELIFIDPDGGLRQFHTSGFTETIPANIFVWNITVPTTTVAITMGAGNISGDTYTIGSSHPAGAKFIATTRANLRTPTISKYVPVNLEAPGSGADWIAITHTDFMSQANELANHRSSFSGLQTYVVDIEDIVDQYGYGLHLPAAIRDYLRHTLSWTTPPGYVVIFGAATYNPRNLDCQSIYCPKKGSSPTWDKDQPTFVVTDLVYEDRFQGLIPSDHSLVLLEGDDLDADMAIGRITANTAAEAEAAVSKIIMYEENQLTAVPWQKNILFVADNNDDGGNFYAENLTTAANHVSGNYSITQRYLEGDTQEETDDLRAAMINDINNIGVSILNYRGHGSVWGWASPNIISTDSIHLDVWNNIQKPVVILSADCLDGNFAFPGIDALSQTLLTLQSGQTPVGAAAFWSSTGLGFTEEHSVLHRGFYDGLFQQNLLTIGDAINYAKLTYNDGGHHDSELFSFLLQGDPAMQMFTMRNEVYLSSIIK